jgi:hypothetical protein
VIAGAIGSGLKLSLQTADLAENLQCKAEKLVIDLIPTSLRNLQKIQNGNFHQIPFPY